MLASHNDITAAASPKPNRTPTSAELVEQIAGQILLRRGEVITAELALERALAIVYALPQLNVGGES